MRAIRLALAASFVLALGAGVVASRARIERFLDPPRDFLLLGRACCDDQSPEAWLTHTAALVDEHRVTLEAEDEQLDLGRAELGFSLDAAGTAARAAELPRASDWLSRLRRAFGPPLAPPNLEPVFAFDAERARARLTTLSSTLYRPAEDAVLSARSHTRRVERAGRTLDVEASLNRLADSDPTATPLRALVFQRLEPKLCLADLPPVDVSLVAGSYETDFRGKAGARAVNIRRAAELLDGLVLLPGTKFSFNRSVGRREKERGFVEAPVIVNDELESGLGGGVCQAATTLHAAARFAGLAITERRSHSRPSGYAPLGLDATVIDDKVDLRFENPFDVALMIHAYLPTPTSVRVEILGRAPDVRIDHRYHVVERRPFQRRVVEKPDLLPGTFERKQKGSYGYDIISVLTLTAPGGDIHTLRYPSKYYPVPEVFAVGPNTSPDLLPPLPEGATGLEGEADEPTAD